VAAPQLDYTESAELDNWRPSSYPWRVWYLKNEGFSGQNFMVHHLSQINIDIFVGGV
jgi:hypothetical protein